MATQSEFDETYLSYLVAYFYDCASSGAYPEPEIAGRMRQVDHFARAHLNMGTAQLIANANLEELLVDTWILLATARVVGSNTELFQIVEGAVALGILRRTPDGTEVLNLDRDSIISSDVSRLETMVSRVSYFHGEIAGALLHAAEVGEPHGDTHDALLLAQRAMRDLRDLWKNLTDALIQVRGPSVAVDSPAASRASREVTQKLSELLPTLLDPAELVVIASPATWANQADEAGPFTFQGVLLATSLNVRFLFNPIPHENIWDLPEQECFIHSQVLRFVKSAHRVSLYNGYRMKLGNKLDLLFSSERPHNPQYFSFYVPKERIREFTNFRF